MRLPHFALLLLALFGLALSAPTSPSDANSEDAKQNPPSCMDCDHMYEQCLASNVNRPPYTRLNCLNITCHALFGTCEECGFCQRHWDPSHPWRPPRKGQADGEASKAQDATTTAGDTTAEDAPAPKPQDESGN
ncbi:hypothetical protein BU26DRAFT_503892 [Trematosphaeria pertusa]|uniref:Uncharacterized protein n=1 Tax=Trematosphaeria pertusa TaxID=390896 RepID=A0A6A6IMP0_9PLEO|nr:uncharacterized protein BU26DRAFT_503892 [Trematosphaeria pertusa]KAF2251368.1 hypothetical protein BU26DRAFT_503892 [Trematosphaeria pertusa]